MLQLSMRLITNGRETINKTSNYFIKDNKMNFKIDDDTYSYDLENDILIKKNKETSIEINPNEKLIMITLLEQNYTFDMPIIESNLKKQDKLIELTYTFDSEEKTTNCIIINY